jgi:hypothetical protein
LQYAPLKRQSTSTRLCGTISQKTVTFNFPILLSYPFPEPNLKHCQYSVIEHYNRRVPKYIHSNVRKCKILWCVHFTNMLHIQTVVHYYNNTISACDALASIEQMQCNAMHAGMTSLSPPWPELAASSSCAPKILVITETDCC